jgi:type VI secretion system protein ImpE
MTPRDALAAGRLDEAVAGQEAVVAAEPDDPVARLFYFELLTLAGQLQRALEQLREIESDEPDWPASRRSFAHLLRAEHRRSRRGRPRFLLDPPRHARHRRAAVRALQAGDLDQTSKSVDRADAISPLIAGHVDGREFEGIRDTDDRFGSVLEVFIGPEYIWVPFEQLRRVSLEVPGGVLDAVYRPARLRLADGNELSGVLPLVYPDSSLAGEEYALGRATDWPDHGNVVVGVGQRILMIGDEELALGACRQIEVRGPRWGG